MLTTHTPPLRLGTVLVSGMTLTSCITPPADCPGAFAACQETCDGEETCLQTCAEDNWTCMDVAWVFDVHFSVITRNPDAIAAATEEQLRTEVDILNTYFVTAEGAPIVRFAYKSASLHADIADVDCAILEMSDDGVEYDSDDFQDAINACDNERVIDPHAINFLVYDFYSDEDGFDDITSRGRGNNHHPYVMIDWARLNHTIQSPEEHEMGHAFALGHVCVPDATSTTSTNIMASGRDCDGHGGLRDLGFDEAQVEIIQTNAALHEATLDRPL